MSRTPGILSDFLKNTVRFENKVRDGDLLFGLYSHHPTYKVKTRRTLLSMSDLNKKDDQLCLFANSKNHSSQSKKKISYKKPKKKYIRSLTLPQKKQLLFLHDRRAYLFKDRRRKLLENDNWINDVFVHRMCKVSVVMGGLTGRRIHFILDGLDHERVVKKIDPATGQRDHSRTSAELRALFRCRTLLDYSKIFFYKDGINVLPPWKDLATKHWYDAYSKERSKKSRLDCISPTLWSVVAAPQVSFNMSSVPSKSRC